MLFRSFLASRSEGQSELTRTDRQEQFWRAWLTRVGEVGANAIAGEGDSGLGRFVSGIAVAPDVSSLPVGAVAGAPDEQFEVNEALLGEEIARSIPYPQSPAPGVRLRVRLLNGTHDPELTAQAAERLVQAGAEITISGNASSFDETTTRILYADEANIEQAQWYAAILGIGAVEADPASEDVASVDESERIDLTVVLGADAPEAFRR